jgi:hypothetical protein
MKIILLILFFFAFSISNEIYTNDNRSNQLKALTSSWSTNWNKHSIFYNELLSGGPSKDGIPALTNPKFETISQAKKWLKNDEPLIFVTIKNQSKAYPLSILIWHEIVNDVLANKEILITFCPLCNSSIVYSRVLNNTTYTFGTSGLLRNSDLVMYDRQSDSLWQQFTGEAIVGDLTNQKLQSLTSSIISFKDIFLSYPNTEILSINTSYDRNYCKNPYSGYDNINSSPFLINRDIDDRLKPMRRVATIEINSKYKAYPYNILKKKNIINDTFENKNIVLFYKKNVLSVLDNRDIGDSKNIGTAIIYDSKVKGKNLEFYYKNGYYDKQTNSKWNILGKAISGELKGEQLKSYNFGSHFWFAWVIFKPNTIVYK